METGRIPGSTGAYQGQQHWQTQKDLMLQNLISGGKSPEEAQALVAQITELQRNSPMGNQIPPRHPDSGNPAAFAQGQAHPPSVQMPAQPPPMASKPQAPVRPAMAQPQPAPAPVAPPSAPSAPPMAPPPSAKREPGQPSILDNPDAVGSVLGMGDLNRQMAQAEQMRDKTVDGRYVSGGRIYHPGSLLEHGVNAYGKYKGMKDTKRIAGEQKDAKQVLIDALRTKRPTTDTPRGAPV